MSSFEAPHVYDIVDQDEMRWLDENGFVREQRHPTEPLGILNYTDKAQVNPKVFADYPSLNECRGLIWNTATGAVVARPFRKFWNYGQAGAAPIELTDIVHVHDKVDGSLGILYREPTTGYPAIATRGSFTSDQAKHATKLIRTKYGEWAERKPALGETLLFEIIYPENRIVLDYGDKDDLVLLGAVEIRTGAVSGPATAAIDHDWSYGAPIAETLFAGTFAEALALPLDRPNAEGYVIRVRKGAPDRAGNMVKIKQEDYVALHRIVTGLNERTVWEHLKAGKDIDELIEPLPDEFHQWVRAVAIRLTGQVLEAEAMLEERYLHYVRQMTMYCLDNQHIDKRQAAKKFAEFVKDDPAPWAMFSIRQGKDIQPKLWDLAKPEPGKNPSNTPVEA